MSAQKKTTSKKKSSSSSKSAATKKRGGKASSGTKRLTAAEKRASEEKKQLYRSETINIVLIFICIVFFLCNTGILGSFGAALSGFEKGVFGWLAYVLPLLIAADVFYLRREIDISIVSLKAAASAVGIAALCTLVHLFSGVKHAESITDYYKLAYTGESLGGGILGGALCHVFSVAGSVGIFLLFFIILLISCVVVFEVSIIDAVIGGADRSAEMVRSGRERYNDVREENKRRRELRREEEARREAERRQNAEARAEALASDRSGKYAGDADDMPADSGLQDTSPEGSLVFDRSSVQPPEEENMFKRARADELYNELSSRIDQSSGNAPLSAGARSVRGLDHRINNGTAASGAGHYTSEEKPAQTVRFKLTKEELKQAETGDEMMRTDISTEQAKGGDEAGPVYYCSTVVTDESVYDSDEVPFEEVKCEKYRSINDVIDGGRISLDDAREYGYAVRNRSAAAAGSRAFQHRSLDAFLLSGTQEEADEILSAQESVVSDAAGSYTEFSAGSAYGVSADGSAAATGSSGSYAEGGLYIDSMPEDNPAPENQLQYDGFYDRSAGGADERAFSEDFAEENGSMRSQDHPVIPESDQVISLNGRPSDIVQSSNSIMDIGIDSDPAEVTAVFTAEPSVPASGDSVDSRTIDYGDGYTESSGVADAYADAQAYEQTDADAAAAHEQDSYAEDRRAYTTANGKVIEGASEYERRRIMMEKLSAASTADGMQLSAAQTVNAQTDAGAVPQGSNSRTANTAFVQAAGLGNSGSAASPYNQADTVSQPAAAQRAQTQAASAQETGVEAPKPRPYVFPPVSLLKKGDNNSFNDQRELNEKALKLQNALKTFGVGVTITKITKGPSVTRYEMTPDVGVKVSQIKALEGDIKLSLAAAELRIEAPIPGKSAVGIEVANGSSTIVAFRDILESDAFRSAKSKVAVGIGLDIQGEPVIGNLAKMPHLLVSGTTGSGKSVGINSIIMSIIYRARPDEVKLIMIDPKVVELSIYNGIPHLLVPVVTKPDKALSALNWACTEMNDRYRRFSESGTRNISGYNDKVDRINETLPADKKQKKMPFIVIIIDELAELMMHSKKEVESAIVSLTQLARAAGIHLVVATQRPSVDVITGLIKANIPSRIAYKLPSFTDSKTILDGGGAEALLGNGDMLYKPNGANTPSRVQGAYISDEEIENIVNYVKSHNSEGYDESAQEIISNAAASTGAGGSTQSSGQQGSQSSDANGFDEYFVDAGRLIIEKNKASIGMLQRMFKIGFNRAARIMDQLCEAGVVSSEEGTKPRQILMSKEEFEAYIG